MVKCFQSFIKFCKFCKIDQPGEERVRDPLPEEYCVIHILCGLGLVPINLLWEKLYLHVEWELLVLKL